MAEAALLIPETSIATPSATREAMAIGEPISQKKENTGLPIIQTKLTVGAPDDPYEKEADAMADKVMRMPEHSFVQRKCAECSEEDEKQVQRKVNTEFIQMKCAAFSHEDDQVNRKTAETITPFIQAKSSQSFDVSDPMAASIESSRGGGARLDDNTQSFMESRFGAGFSQVNIHTDSNSLQMNRQLNAQAFTVGNDIFFNEHKYSPGTSEGKQLLAHELTHTIQQSGGIQSKIIQRDFAIEPLRPGAVGRVLTQRQIEAAIQFNSVRITLPDEIALVRDIIGLSRNPAAIDDDFVNAMATYQAQYRETSDGKIGPSTMARLAQEIRAAASFLTASGKPLGNLDVAFALQTQLEGFVTAANRTYADYKAAIQAGSVLNRNVVLLNVTLLNNIKGLLSWNNFARVVELLGRVIPTAAMLLATSTVRAALAGAFADSDAAVSIWDTHDPDPAFAADPCNPAPGAGVATTAHEEGGWVYLNIITNVLTTRRAARGVQAGINVEVPAPPTLADSVIVATFHTHPNVGACWSTAARPVFPSGADTRNAAGRGVPNLIRGAFPGVADIHDVNTGPTRLHIAGSQLFPGAAGGLTPQVSILRNDEDAE